MRHHRAELMIRSLTLAHPTSPVTWRPLPDTGQEVITGQVRHLALTTAWKVDAAMVAAVRRTMLAAQPGSAASDNGAWSCSLTLVWLPSCTSTAPPASVPASGNAPA